MKKVLIPLLVFALFAGCSTGYIGSEGDFLREYLEPSALLALTQNPADNIWIIDVRPADAYQRGHIPTARSFPSGEVMSRLAELPKEQYLILYCETGGRAQSVINNLEDAGYTRLMNWGGYTRWPYELVTD